ncbi:roundabout homolog 1-like [Corticium candelabrum]|uniref:roundabout homolog 1-like n=1 Tax=Corticium candelabrum TaxID=121492 RepID=UPI002E25ECC7|nr:roundabout homolog 1-like [Corticium candelabrum]
MVKDGPRHTLRGDNLTISQVIRSDNGTYECILGNERYNISANATLTVEYGPAIVFGPVNVKILKNYNARFQCNVTGQPKPIVQWLHKRRYLSRTLPRYQVEETDGAHSLTIRNVKETDNGRYICSVINIYGIATSSAKLTAVDIPWNVNKTIVYGQNDTLGTKVLGADIFIIQWTKDGNAINYTDNSRITKNTDGTLLITKASFDDSGEYVWTSVFGLDQINQRISVTVRGKMQCKYINHYFSFVPRPVCLFVCPKDVFCVAF